MTVRELVKHLQTFPQDLTVICTRCSDYQTFETDEVYLVEAVDRGENAGYLMSVIERHKPTMSADDLVKVQKYVHFNGN